MLCVAPPGALIFRRFPNHRPVQGLYEDYIVTDPAVVENGPSAETSVSLLERIRARDQAAWSRFVRLYGPIIYGWCLRAGLRPEDAADIGQEVFTAVARGIGGFRYDRPGDTFRGWLFTITRNKLRDWFSSRGGTGIGGSDAQRRLAETLAAEPNVESASGDKVDPSEVKGLYRRAIELVRSEFESRTWEAFWRTFVDGQAPADVALDLGIRPNAVYLARSRILRRLREEFNQLVDFGPVAPR
jgi:RNA polymerase sigma-70 factor (ECF subfamily)